MKNRNKEMRKRKRKKKSKRRGERWINEKSEYIKEQNTEEGGILEEGREETEEEDI